MSNLVKAKVVDFTKLPHPQLLQWLASGLDQLLLIDLAWINLRHHWAPRGVCFTNTGGLQVATFFF